MTTTDNDIAQLIGLAGARPPLPEDRAQRIRAAVLPAWLEGTRSRKRRRAWRAAVLAAAATLVAAAGLVLWRPGTASDLQLATAVRLDGPSPEVIDEDGSSALLSEGAAVHAGQRIASSSGLVALRLESGASLRIDSATDIRLSSSSLLELKRGAVYVDSGAGAVGAAGLSIKTPLGTVREIGTRFEVRVDETGLRVRVRDGAVRLDGAGGSARGEAADELRLGTDGWVRRGKVSAHDPGWDWALRVAPAFALDGRTVGSFLEWMERESGWTVRFDDDSIRAEIERTTIRGPKASTSPREALPLVMAACELSFHLDDGVVTIYEVKDSGGTE